MTDEALTTEHVRQTFAYVQAGLDDDDGYPFVMHIHVDAFDAWLASVERAAAEKAWAEGWAARASRGYAHLKVGESVPAPKHINPYRREEA